jgi:hypothetical protein
VKKGTWDPNKGAPSSGIVSKTGDSAPIEAARASSRAPTTTTQGFGTDLAAAAARQQQVEVLRTSQTQAHMEAGPTGQSNPRDDEPRISMIWNNQRVEVTRDEFQRIQMHSQQQALLQHAMQSQLHHPQSQGFQLQMQNGLLVGSPAMESVGTKRPAGSPNDGPAKRAKSMGKRPSE